MKYAFYPGCSLQRTARPYLDSIMAIREIIGLELEEIEDWNCCGATEYGAVHHLAAFALVARNLALAAQQTNGSKTVTTACSACYLNLAKTDSYMWHDAQLNMQVNEALSAGRLHYRPGTLSIRHLLDIVVNDIGLAAIKSHVVRPLKGLRVAPYYGCMIARPDPDHRWDKVEHPMALDRLMKALDADVIDFPLKTHCCGGHMTQINLPVAYDLIRRLVHAAVDCGADLIVTLCPMCQLNLDAFQGEMNRYFHTEYRMPIVYFTQLMGLAFGVDADMLGLGKGFVDPQAALSRIGAEAVTAEPAAAPARARRHKKNGREALPMPRMNGREEVEE